MNNERFFGYYRAQRLFVRGREGWGKLQEHEKEENGKEENGKEEEGFGEEEEKEWNAFVDCLRRHLPTTFRIAGSRE